MTARPDRFHNIKNYAALLDTSTARVQAHREKDKASDIVRIQLRVPKRYEKVLKFIARNLREENAALHHRFKNYLENIVINKMQPPKF